MTLLKSDTCLVSTKIIITRAEVVKLSADTGRSDNEADRDSYEADRNSLARASSFNNIYNYLQDRRISGSIEGQTSLNRSVADR